MSLQESITYLKTLDDHIRRVLAAIPALTPVTTTKQPVGTIIPLYTYPTNRTWQDTIDAKKAHPTVPIVAVVNPASGVGANLNVEYVDGIKKLQAAGVIVLGYVPTGYGKRAINSVYGEIRWWQNWYNVNGIFFDEQSNTVGGSEYYKAASTYAKNTGMSMTVGNPGTDTLPEYLEACDVTLIYEFIGVPALNNYKTKWEGYDNKKLGMIPYGVITLPAEWITQAAAFVSWIYITNDILGNPWDTLPPYFNEMIAALDQLA